jgi:hypothetical protein
MDNDPLRGIFFNYDEREKKKQGEKSKGIRRSGYQEIMASEIEKTIYISS